MRVLLDVSAIPERPVGAGVYVVNIVRELARRSDLTLVLLARRDDEYRWRDWAPRAHVLAVAPTRRPARLVWEQTTAPQLSDRFDVWHGPHYTLPLRAKCPTVVTVHDLTFFDRPEVHERSKVAYFRRMIGAATRRATEVIAVSEYTARKLQDRFPSVRNVTVIPHGVDHARFTPDAAPDVDEKLLHAHGIRAPFIAYVGTIEPRKDIPTLIKAFARVALERPELRLVVAGRDGWGATEVRHATEQSGVATRIIRPGYLPDDTVAALLRRAAAVAYPSLEEGFGLPVLEAMACGAPVITTLGSATAEVAGGGALLVEPGNETALAAALTTVLGDPSVASRLRADGAARAAEFTWAASADRHVQVYSRVSGSSA